LPNKKAATCTSSVQITARLSVVLLLTSRNNKAYSWTRDFSIGFLFSIYYLSALAVKHQVAYLKLTDTDFQDKHRSAGYSQQVPLYVYDESHEDGYLNNNRFHKLDSLAWRVMFIYFFCTKAYAGRKRKKN
jgi:hypothetical protein